MIPSGFESRYPHHLLGVMHIESDRYTVYTNRDGRLRVYDKETQKVISYPKFIMQKHLGRELTSREQVHHIDGNPLNNDLENLEIRQLGEHRREHSTKYVDVITNCFWCGKEFLWTAEKQKQHYGNYHRKERKDRTYVGPFCSKRCVGLYGKYIEISGYGENGSTHRS